MVHFTYLFNSKIFMQNLWNDITSTAGIRTAIVGVLGLLGIFLLAQSISTFQGVGTFIAPSPYTITVSGEGTATAVPDTATVSFGATATAADVASAQSKITGIINNALVSVKAAGISDKDITTNSFNVSPHYNQVVCPPGGMCPVSSPAVSGYDVSENITVKIHDTTKVATVLDGLAKAKVTDVSGPEFVVGDTQAVEAEARGKAIAKAQADAVKLAAQLGVKLGKMNYFSEDTSGDGYSSNAKGGAFMATDVAAVPTVPVGQNTYTKDVSITYEIH